MSRRPTFEDFDWAVDLSKFADEEIQDSDSDRLSENTVQPNRYLGEISFTIALQIHAIHSFLQLPRFPRMPPRQ